MRPADTAVGVPAAGWEARLELGFQRRGRRTVVARRRHHGPLVIQRPFYPEDDGSAHVYLLHPPGGVVGGDRLSLSVNLEDGASALLTTPAATKFYRCEGTTRASLDQHLVLAPGSALEWLPQENILFRGARARIRTRVTLGGDARFMGWEIVSLGRPACEERFDAGACDQRLEIWHDGQPLYLERGRYADGGPAITAPWGLGERPLSATLVAWRAVTPAPLEAARAALGSPVPGEHLGASCLDGLVVCRYLGRSAARARAALERAWHALRPALLVKAASPPRIWST